MYMNSARRKCTVAWCALSAGLVGRDRVSGRSCRLLVPTSIGLGGVKKAHISIEFGLCLESVENCVEKLVRWKASSIHLLTHVPEMRIILQVERLSQEIRMLDANSFTSESWGALGVSLGGCE